MAQKPDKLKITQQSYDNWIANVARFHNCDLKAAKERINKRWLVIVVPTESEANWRVNLVDDCPYQGETLSI